MRHCVLFSSIFYILLAPVYANDSAGAKGREIVVPNFDQESPSCHVLYPAESMNCNGDGCDIPVPARSSLKKIQLTLSCIPISAPTGFDNPPSNARIISIQTPSSKGHVSLIDEPPEEPGERMRELYFCLYGNSVRLCGFAKTLVLKDGESADASKKIINILKTLVLENRAGLN